MTRKRALALAAALLLFLAAPTAFAVKKAAERKRPPAVQKEPPIQIVADRLDAYNEKRLVIFSGNAVATQEDKTIKADRLLLYYRSDPEASLKGGVQGMAQGGDLEKIEAEGHVVITQGDRTVTGDSAVFYQDRQEVVITGNTTLKEGSNVIQGEKVVVYLAENRAVIDGAQNKRVKAIFFPKEIQDEKKKK